MQKKIKELCLFITITLILIVCFSLVLISSGLTAQAKELSANPWSECVASPLFTKDALAPVTLTVESTPSPTPTPQPVPIGEQAVQIAKSYIGVPYVWGGTSPSGFDCSGLVQYVYARLGIDISRTTYTQINDGRSVAKSELKGGDLVFFANSNGVHHVGIYIGSGQFIHAPQTGDVVKISNLNDRSDYYGARRIVE